MRNARTVCIARLENVFPAYHPGSLVTSFTIVKKENAIPMGYAGNMSGKMPFVMTRIFCVTVLSSA